MADDIRLKFAAEGVTAALGEIQRVRKGVRDAAEEIRRLRRSDSGRTRDAFEVLGLKSTAGVTREVQRLEAAFNRLRRSGTTSARDIARAQTALQQKVRETRGETARLGGALNGAGALAARVFSAAVVVRWGQAVFEAGVQAQRWQRALTAATGSQQQAGREMAFVRAEAERLGLALGPTVDGFVGISAAARGTALEGAATREIFLGVAEASAALGISADNTQGVLLAVQQIISKGTVSAEELRGQLGERLPGAFQIAARSVGVTTEELGQMLEAGELLAEDFLPKFAKQLREEFGAQASEGANSAQAAFNRLGNAVDDLNQSLAESGLLDAFSTLIGFLTEIVKLLKFSVLGFRLLGAAAAIPGQVLDNLRAGRENPLDDALAAFKSFGVGELERLRLVEATNEKIVGAEEQLKSDRARIAGQLTRAESALHETEVALAERSTQARIALERDLLADKQRGVREGLAVVRQGLAAALAAEQRFFEQVRQLREQQAEQQRSIADQIRDLRRRGLTEAEQQADVEKQIATKLIDAKAALDEDGETALARDLAGEARALVGGVQDAERAIALLSGVGDVLRQASEAEVAAAEKARTAERERITELQTLAAGGERALQAIAAELERLSADPKTITLQTNFDEQLAKVQALRAELAALENASATAAAGGAPVKRRLGGPIPGWGGGDRVPALLERGEFVIRKEAVRQVGPAALAAINGMRLPRRMPALPGAMRFAEGGPVPAASGVPGVGGQDFGRLELVIGGRPHPIFAERDTLRGLVDALAEGARGR